MAECQRRLRHICFSDTSESRTDDQVTAGIIRELKTHGSEASMISPTSTCDGHGVFDDLAEDDAPRKQRPRMNTMEVMAVMDRLAEMENEAEANKQLLEQARRVGCALDDSYRQLDELTLLSRELEEANVFLKKANAFLKKKVEDLENDLQQAPLMSVTAQSCGGRSRRKKEVMSEANARLLEDLSQLENENQELADRIRHLEQINCDLIHSSDFPEDTSQVRRKSLSMARETEIEELQLLQHKMQERCKEAHAAFEEEQERSRQLQQQWENDVQAYEDKLVELQTVITHQEERLAREAAQAADGHIASSSFGDGGNAFLKFRCGKPYVVGDGGNEELVEARGLAHLTRCPSHFCVEEISEKQIKFNGEDLGKAERKVAEEAASLAAGAEVHKKTKVDVEIKELDVASDISGSIAEGDALHNLSVSGLTVPVRKFLRELKHQGCWSAVAELWRP